MEIIVTEEKPPYIFYNNKWIPTGFPSWVWDEATEKYVAPVPIPDNKNYGWNEATLSWDEIGL